MTASTKHIFVYAGSVTVSNLTYDRLTQTLECNTTGGPATNLIWSKDNVQIDLPSMGKYIFSQEVIDPLTAVYRNKLRIYDKGKLDSGTYECIAKNILSEDSFQIIISGILNCYIINTCTNNIN